MAIARTICLALSTAIIVLWLVAWLPQEWLPEPVYWFVFWFGGILTFLLIPAGVGVWWGMKGRSKSGLPGESA